MIARLIHEEEGQAIVEYGLIASSLVIGLYVAAKGLIALQGTVYDNQHQALKGWRAP